jgi:DedD protein
MARSTSDEEIKLRKRARRRLIGAIALTTLVVVTLPMVLDSEPRPVGDDIAVQIPSPNSGPYAPKVQGEAAPRPAAGPSAPPKASGTLETAPSASASASAAADPAPAGDTTPARPAGTPQASTVPSSATPADQKIEVAGAPRRVTDTAAAAAKAAEAKTAEAKIVEARAAEVRAAEVKAADAKAAAAKVAAAKGADPGDAEAKSFVIQLGAFAEVNRAKDRHAQLVKAGIRSYTEVIKTPTGDKTRVRAGPFPTRQAAEQANERVKVLGMADGIVVPRRY